MFVDATKVLIDRADNICTISVDMFNTEDTSDKIRQEHHTPWKGYVTDKIRGTWSRIRGKGHLKSDDGNLLIHLIIIIVCVWFV